jgi:hypothetical protein
MKAPKELKVARSLAPSYELLFVLLRLSDSGDLYIRNKSPSIH